MVTDQPTQAPQIDFPGKDPGEEFRFYFRRHWIHLARSFVQLILWMIAFVIFTYISGVAMTEDPFTRRVLVVLLGLFFVSAHMHFIVKLYRHFLCITIVTDKKLHNFKRTLIAVDVHSSVDLWVLQDIDKMQRGIVQNMFGFGSIKLEAQNSQLKIHFVPKIDEVYEAIVSLRELARSMTLPEQAKEKLEQKAEQAAEEVAETTA